jgi:hypothetical protein
MVNLGGAHAGQPLDRDHRRDRGAEVFERRLDVRIGDWTDRLGLGGIGSAPLQTVHGLERLIDGCRHQFFAGSPLEDAPDPADFLVDVLAGVATPDHPLAHRLESQRPEGRGDRVPVQLPQFAKGVAVVRQFRGRPAVGVAVMALSELPEQEEQLVDRQVRP